MKIAILGSTGFLGKVLLEKALNAGYQVRTLVRNPAGKVSADEKNLSKTNVNVEDLADFMLAQIDSKEWLRRAPLVGAAR